MVNFYGTYERGLVIIDITMACNLSIQRAFFPTKIMGILVMNIHFGPFEDTAPGTDLCRIFCAGIGPLPLGVVLVMLFSRCALLSGREATHC